MVLKEKLVSDAKIKDLENKLAILNKSDTSNIASGSSTIINNNGDGSSSSNTIIKGDIIINHIIINKSIINNFGFENLQHVKNDTEFLRQCMNDLTSFSPFFYFFMFLILKRKFIFTFKY